MLARLIRGYNFRFQPRWHGVDLVESLHVVLGMLDRLSAAGGCIGFGVLGWAGLVASLHVVPGMLPHRLSAACSVGLPVRGGCQPLAHRSRCARGARSPLAPWGAV